MELSEVILEHLEGMRRGRCRWAMSNQEGTDSLTFDLIEDMNGPVYRVFDPESGVVLTWPTEEVD